MAALRARVELRTQLAITASSLANSAGQDQHIDYVYQYSHRRWRWECLDCGVHGFCLDSPYVIMGVTRMAKGHECDLENLEFMLARFGRHTINNM